ncbi:MAG: ABC transporter ATP-binding protein [Spirochaetes bacterium]|nr:ABC transporter ATP-binding protein [Spirochaetota bacterium]
MLTVRKISTIHGKIQALWDVSIEVNEGEIVALIGANGAGKTTLLDTISGTYIPVSGTVEFQCQRIEGKTAAYIVEKGISHVPQGGRLFSDMTVRENLEMGAYSRHAWKQRMETIERICKMFPRLKERENQVASTLSGGEKQMLAIGRGLMSRPKLCIFDEPSYGLSPKAVMEIFHVIRSLPKQGITVLLVEQNVSQALEMANRAYVLENGRITLQGNACDLLMNDYVRKAYLGL